MKKEQEKKIIKHGDNLKALFNLNIDSITLCKKVRRLENKAHKIAIDYCNGVIDTDQIDTVVNPVLESLDKILNFKAQKIPVIFNADARGYALKIHDNYIRQCRVNIHTDMGGYGIIAPEIN